VVRRVQIQQRQSKWDRAAAGRSGRETTAKHGGDARRSLKRTGKVTPHVRRIVKADALSRGSAGHAVDDHEAFVGECPDAHNEVFDPRKARANAQLAKLPQRNARERSQIAGTPNSPRMRAHRPNEVFKMEKPWLGVDQLLREVTSRRTLDRGMQLGKD
jgi:hypothetical protein